MSERGKATPEKVSLLSVPGISPGEHRVDYKQTLAHVDTSSKAPLESEWT